MKARLTRPLALAICCLLAILPTARADGEGIARTLAAAFTDGRARLVEAEWFEAAGQDLTLVVPAAWLDEQDDFDSPVRLTRTEDGATWEGTLPAGTANALLPQCTPLSIGPDGCVLLRYEETLLALRGNRIALLCPVRSRGVEDEYDELSRCMQLCARALPGAEGAVWSPDGRYVALPSYEQAIINARFFIELVIMDTRTGQVFLATSTPDVPAKGGGALLQCRFDASGRYVYYTYYGGGYSYRCSLMRYDLETGESELLHNSDNFFAYPALWETADGRFINLTDQREADKAGGLNVYAPPGSGTRAGGALGALAPAESGVWTYSGVRCPLPIRIWRPRSLEYSAKTGLGLITGFVGSNMSFVFQRFSGEAFDGLDEFWVLNDGMGPDWTPEDGVKPCEAKPIDLKGLLADDASGAGLMQQFEECASVAGARVSPDGRYAIFFTAHSGTYAFTLLDMETMETIPVDAPEHLLTGGIGSALGRAYAPGITWCEDGRLLLFDEGGVTAWRIR